MTSFQLSKWYQRTVKFLPLHLLHVDTQDGGGTGDYYVTEVWQVAIYNYLSHHPCPGAAYLQKFKAVLPVIDELSMRNQARVLLHRCALTAVIELHVFVTWLTRQRVMYSKRTAHGHATNTYL